MSNPTTNTTARKLCPITLEQFKAAAPSLYVSFDRGDLPADFVLYVSPKAFSTGSIGLWGQDKIQPKIGGLAVPCQVGANMILCGTGTAPKEVRDTAFTQLKGMRLGFHFVAAGQDAPQGDGVKLAITKAPFSTGSFGWNVSAKLAITDGPLSGDMLQVGINVTAAGSKPQAPAASA